MTDSDENRGRSRRLGAEDREWSNTSRVFGDQTIERSGNTVCGLHHAQGDEEYEFLGLGSKLRSTVSPSLTSKSLAVVFLVCPQNHSLGFFGLGLKIDNCGLVIWLTKSP
jgi:hypothetical protein